MTENKNNKRYYKIGEQVWYLENRKVGIVKNINAHRQEMTVYTTDIHGDRTQITDKMWKFDKLRGHSDYEDGIIAEDELFKGLQLFGVTPEDFGISFLPDDTSEEDDEPEAGGGQDAN